MTSRLNAGGWRWNVGPSQHHSKTGFAPERQIMLQSLRTYAYRSPEQHAKQLIQEAQSGELQATEGTNDTLRSVAKSLTDEYNAFPIDDHRRRAHSALIARLWALLSNLHAQAIG